MYIDVRKSVLLEGILSFKATKGELKHKICGLLKRMLIKKNNIGGISVKKKIVNTTSLPVAKIIYQSILPLYYLNIAETWSIKR